MPGNLLFANREFPQDPKDTKAILNYLYMLQEELRYTMGNMSGDNFNDTGLTDLSNIVTHDLSITVQNAVDSVDAVASSVVTLQGEATDQGAALTLLAGYTGQSGVVTIATTAAWNALSPKVTTTIYYVTQTAKYMKWNGTDWTACNNIAEASFTLAAINGLSSASIIADRINFTGFTTFLTAADVGAGGSTVIDGGRISTGTLFTESLAAVEADDGYDYIAMQDGFDFRNASYMPFTNASYVPWSRSIQGLHALVFHGDAVLDAYGAGTAGNAPTAVTGYIRNIQSNTGAVTQSGVEIISARTLKLEAQAIGGATSGAGVAIFSRGLNALAEGEYSYELLVNDTGIYASKFRKISGVVTALDTTTLYS